MGGGVSLCSNAYVFTLQPVADVPNVAAPILAPVSQSSSRLRLNPSLSQSSFTALPDFPCPVPSVTTPALPPGVGRVASASTERRRTPPAAGTDERRLRSPGRRRTGLWVVGVREATVAPTRWLSAAGDAQPNRTRADRRAHRHLKMFAPSYY